MFEQLKGYFTAFKEAIRNLFINPITVRFPEENVEVTDGFRGVPQLIPDKCKLCRRCERACPTDAITITKIDDNQYQFIVDLGRCCYCQECEKKCNFNAIKLSSDWLTADTDRKRLKQIHRVEKH